MKKRSRGSDMSTPLFFASGENRPLDEAAPAFCCRAMAGCKEAGKPAKIHGPLFSIPSIFLGLTIAFFPKCPVCWAAYLSVLSIVEATKVPYVPWMYPLLVTALCIHLTLMRLASRRIGNMPLVLALAGTLVICLGRRYPQIEDWAGIPGILLIAIGSLWITVGWKKPGLVSSTFLIRKIK